MKWSVILTLIATTVTFQVPFQNNPHDVVTTSSKYPQFSLSSTSSVASLNLDTVNQTTGYLSHLHHNFFYWFFESRNDPVNDPIILWLTGGPHCSSSYGLFFELGPSSIGFDLKPKYNPYSWNSNASVIFLDQPTYTGFSYGGAPTFSTNQAMYFVYVFIELFFKQNPQYLNNAFHIAGESYAGHYIPNLLHEILSHDDRLFNLSSVLIGNGIIDPLIQIGSYKKMACGEAGHPRLLNETDCQEMQDKYAKFKQYDQLCYDYGDLLSCVIARRLGQEVGKPFSKLGLNPYDVRKQCIANTSDCYLESQPIDEYLNLPDVQAAIGVNNVEFVMCHDDYNFGFEATGDNMRPLQQYLQELLDLDIPVLIYAGDKDFVCSWIGLLEVADTLGYKDFERQPLEKWVTEKGKTAGEIKQLDKLTFIRVYEAGHMVPFDQPENALDLVNRWIGKRF
ncbi:Carboxypeptidase Y [Candida viswanathii]|uniref:Carboxypeptidase n=1 Tax=Candida viswanathii TaxID=5486 RepID=A0A367Y2S1_9ASCO|nr:Carboxypeptidase Y [Candida viswanathii]